MRAVRVQAFRARRTNRADTPSRFTRLNTVFTLDERFVPGADVLRWQGPPCFDPAGRRSRCRCDEPAVLEMRGIRKAFPGVVALDGVDLTLNAGEVHMLLGENGAGKSTLMKILSGAYRKDSGEIRVHGRDPSRSAVPRDALQLGIRVIYQELNLVPHLSVAENIFLGAAPTRGPGIHRLAAAVGIAHRACSPISGWTSTPTRRCIG